MTADPVCAKGVWGGNFRQSVNLTSSDTEKPLEFVPHFMEDPNEPSRNAFFRNHCMLDRILLTTSLLLLLFSTGTLSAQDPSLDALKLQTWPQLYIADADGGNMQIIFSEQTGRAELSANFSRDGRLLIFDAYNAGQGEKTNTSKIYLYNLETNEERELTDGSMPSISPRGKRIIFYRYQSPGVWIADTNNIDDTENLLDERGVGAAWSPDGTKLAWASYSNGPNIKILDIVEGEEWTVFETSPSVFRSLYYNLAWSPDSRNIVFQARERSRLKSLYAVEVLDERQPVRLLEDSNLHDSTTWHPDGSKILYPTKDKETQLFRLMTIEPLKPEKAPVPLEKLPAGLNAISPCYTPDGGKIVFGAYITETKADAEDKPKP